MDFLNRIVNSNKKIKEELANFRTVDDVPIKEDETPIAMELDEVIDMDTDADTTDEISHFDGSCFRCKSKVACVLFLNCKHLATCEECWDLFQSEHIEDCHTKHGNNIRKLNRELKRLVCPVCKENLSKITPYSIIHPTKF